MPREMLPEEWIGASLLGAFFGYLVWRVLSRCLGLDLMAVVGGLVGLVLIVWLFWRAPELKPVD